jgi:GntR family transcriptional regulator, phosphonate transport system regulatory protein
MAVERGGGVTLWQQIADRLETEIVSGRLAPGMRLPTETEMAAQYQVNRHTVRRALGELGRKGLVHAAPRRGTFVTKPRIAYPVGPQSRFSENIKRAGRLPAGKLFSCHLGQAPAEMATWLGIAQVSEVVEIRVLRLANDVPIALVTSWLPADRFSRIGNIFAHVGSFSKAFARMGIKRFRRTRTRITSRLATKEERELLSVPNGAVILLIETLDVDLDGEPIAGSRAVFAADRVELLVES